MPHTPQPLPAAHTPQSDLEDALRDYGTARNWPRIAAALLVSLAADATVQLGVSQIAEQIALVMLSGLASLLPWVLLPWHSAPIPRWQARRTVFIVWALLLTAAILVMVPQLSWVGWFIATWILGFLVGATLRPYVFGSTPRNHRLGTRAS